MARNNNSLFAKIKRHWNWSRLKSNLKWFLTSDISEELYKVKDEAVEDCVYEFEDAKSVLPTLKIASTEETLQILASAPRSFARFGDGELSIINGLNISFQDYDEKLAERLKTILACNRDDLYIGINGSYFQTPFKYSSRNHKFYRINNARLRRQFLSACNHDVTYLDAACFGAYFRFTDDFDYDRHYGNVSKLFRGKKICLVGGRGALAGIKYSIFDEVEEMIVIEAPSRDAFSEYDFLLHEIGQRVPVSYIVCLMLGPTATVMAADLAVLGYVAWDIGHAPQDYDAFMRKIPKTEEEAAKFWSADDDVSTE